VLLSQEAIIRPTTVRPLGSHPRTGRTAPNRPTTVPTSSNNRPVHELADRADEFKTLGQTTQPEVMDAWLKLYRRIAGGDQPHPRRGRNNNQDVTQSRIPNQGKDVVEQRWTAALGMTLAQSTWEFGRT